MKSNAIVRIVLFAIAILVLVGILAAGLLAEAFPVLHFGSGDTLVNGTQSSSFIVDSAKVKNLEIQWAAGSVTIQPGETEDNAIYVSETGADSEDQRLVWKESGGTLHIQFCEPRVFVGISFDGSKDLTITVPSGWECGSLEIDAASANVDVSDLTIKEVDFDGASGNCSFENCHVDEIDLDGASGNIRFSGTLNELSCDAASADCTIILQNVPKLIDMDMASGDLDLTLPESCSGFTAEVDGLSTSFHSDFATTNHDGRHTYGDGSCRINVSAMSGDVRIYKAQPQPVAAEVFTVSYADSDTEELIIEPLMANYHEGAIVTIKTNILYDADLQLYVDGEFVCSQTAVKTGDAYTHWEFYFQMPDHDVTIQLKVSGGM